MPGDPALFYPEFGTTPLPVACSLTKLQEQNERIEEALGGASLATHNQQHQGQLEPLGVHIFPKD